MRMSIEEFSRIFPEVYHMAEDGTWESIKKNGLCSTEALLDLYGVIGNTREAILTQHRPRSVKIQHKDHGEACIRDQQPMSDVGLEKALRDGLTPKDWYQLLNGYVFFWATKKRLSTLLSARLYRDSYHTVLSVDTKKLLLACKDSVRLSPYNSGATKPNPFPRGKDCFLPLDQYPFSYWKKKRTLRNSVAEVVVQYSVPDICSFVNRVDRMKGSTVVASL